MIAIIDYELGNVTSVKNALAKQGIPVVISNDSKEIKQSEALILPGVGAAGQGMENLRKRNLDTLISFQIRQGKPLLGICLGMQLLFSSSDEGNTECLTIVKGNVRKFKGKLKVPQIGWNQVKINGGSKLLKGIRDSSYFYFVNSYYCDPRDKSIIVGTTEYGQTFCSVLEKENIFGVQFHPEKSGEVGLQLLRNFWEVVC